MHFVDPVFAAYDPAIHGVHDIAPVVLDAVPFKHGVHVDDPGLRYVPASHSVGVGDVGIEHSYMEVEVLNALTIPAAQGVNHCQAMSSVLVTVRLAVACHRVAVTDFFPSISTDAGAVCTVH